MLSQNKKQSHIGKRECSLMGSDCQSTDTVLCCAPLLGIHIDTDTYSGDPFCCKTLDSMVFCGLWNCSEVGCLTYLLVWLRTVRCGTLLVALEARFCSMMGMLFVIRGLVLSDNL